MVKYRSVVLAGSFFLVTAGFAWSTGALIPERLVDSSTPIPGGSSTFFLDNVPPAPCGLGTVFQGNDLSLTQSGIYSASSSGVVVVADETTVLPDGEALDDLESPDCESWRVVFLEGDSDAGRSRILASIDGDVKVLVDEAVAAPQGGGVLSGFGQPATAGGISAFTASIIPIGVSGVFLIDDDPGGLLSVADTRTLVPGELMTFAAFGGLSLSTQMLAFRGFFGLDGDGIYGWSDGELRALVDEQTMVPGHPGLQFSSFGNPSVWGERVVFTASHPEGRGIYELDSERLEEVFEAGDTAPGGGVFLDFDRPSAGQRGVAFFALTSLGDRALFLLWDGTLHRVAGIGDSLDGEQLLDITFTLGETALAFRALFADSSQAIYGVRLPTAEVPTVGTLALSVLIFLLTLLGVRRLRRDAHPMTDRP